MKNVEFVNVSKRYGDKLVFSGLDLSVEAGRITALMGPSGLGKTTLLRMVLGLEDFEGEIRGLEGVRLAAAFQEPRLLPWFTLQRNLELACGDGPETKRSIEAALRVVELSHEAQKKPSQLSGGMQKRASLARALAFPSDMLVLDEPFTGLDEELRDRVSEALSSEWRRSGKTVLFVTHDSAAAARADRIIRMQDISGQKEASQ